MRILLESRAFHPSVGGLEMMSETLARAWSKAGHEVRLVTTTALDEAVELDELTIYRKPSLNMYWTLTRWADVFVQSGISLRSIMLPWAVGCPLVIIHHNPLRARVGRSGFLNKLKRYATIGALNVAVSRPVAATVPGPATIIPNTLRPPFAALHGSVKAERSGLLFVGRMVSNKGCDIALRALRQLHDWGVEETLMLCGGGPDRTALEQQARALGLQEFVRFAGWASSDELMDFYRHAAVTLVPSRYEPFGIVALEAIACGSPVVASNTGGLPEAVGPCGLLADPANVKDLALKIRFALEPSVKKALMLEASDHMAKHNPERIAQRYLRVLHAAVNRKPIPDPV